MEKDLTRVVNFFSIKQASKGIFTQKIGGGSDLIIALPQMRGGRFI